MGVVTDNGRWLAAGLAVLAGLGADGLAAQTPPAEPSAAAQEEVDELDILSRTTDDQFPDIKRTAERRPISVTVRALDKVTAKYTDLEINMGESVEFGSLAVLARFCDKRPPEEFPEASAFLQIFDRRAAQEDAADTLDENAPDDGLDLAGAADALEDGIVRRGDAQVPDGVSPAAEDPVGEDRDPTLDPALAPAAPAPEPSAAALATLTQDVTIPDGEKVFSGWMFASSPALNPLEHPVYDVWVIDCQTEIVSEGAPEAE